MYRLLDYTHTKRYLKIQNTFSTKKYPIYFSHDPQTLETYVTKVIASKEPVITCYKAHISQNILPYLVAKRQHQNASIISLPVDQAEVIIKIDQEEKNKKCDFFKIKIEECEDLFCYYRSYHKNGKFKDQIDIIKQFLSKFQAKNNELIVKIQQMQRSFGPILHLLDFIDHIEIKNDKIIQKMNSLNEKQQQTAYEEKLRDFIGFLKQLSKKENIIGEQTLKSNEMFQLEKGLETSFQMLSKITDILKQIQNLKQDQSANQIQYLYNQLQKHEKSLELQKRNIYESNTLYITKKYVKGLTLREMILNKDQRLTPQFCLDLTKAIVDFIFMYGGVKDLFITTENIIVQDCGTFHLNYFSFVGLEFVKLQKYVSKADFLQILPYINSDYLYGGHENQLKMGIQVFLRFIIVNFVSAFLKKDIIFDSKSIDFEVEVKMSNLAKQMKEIDDRLLIKILPSEERSKIQRQFDLLHKVNYAELADAVFNSTNNRKRLNWQFIFSKMSKSESGTSKQLYHTSGEHRRQKISILYIADNIKHLSTMEADAFYVIELSFMQTVDHFINILDQFYNRKDLFGQLGEKNQEKVKKLVIKLIHQRSYFEKKGWYCKEIYIPVRSSMTFTQILDYSNWIEMLNSENRINLQTIKGVDNLLSFMLQIQETLVLIEPFLNDDFLDNALVKEKCTYYTDFYQEGKTKTYYTILHNYKDSKPKKMKKKQIYQEITLNMREDSDESISDRDQPIDHNGLLNSDSQSSDNEEYNFKKIFWRCFFSTLKIVYMLIKNYYLRINEISISGGIMINGGKYGKWLEEYSPVIPQFTTLQ